MKVKLKEDYLGWKAGVPYFAQPIFWHDEERVSVNLPGSDICVLMKWEEIEVVE